MSYREIKDHKTIKLTNARVVSRSPIADIAFNGDGKPVSITYKVMTQAGTEVVALSYTEDGSPIHKGISYLGATVNIFQAEIVPLINATVPVPDIIDITLSASTVFEGAAPGIVVGNLAIVGGSPPASFAVITDANDLFEASDQDLVVKNLLTGNEGIYPITIRAVDSLGSVFEKNYNITITPYSSIYSSKVDGISEFLEAPSNAAWMTNDRSVSLWLKATDTGSNQFVVNKHNSSYPGWRIYADTSSRIRFEIYETSTIYKLYRIDPSQNPIDGTWKHLAWTFNSATGEFRVYLNGSYVIGGGVLQKGRDDTMTAINDNPDWPLTVGASYNGTSHTTHIDGNFDELALWNTVLSDADITDIYNLGTPKSLLQESYSPGLVSWWRMGDGDTAPNVTDSMNVATLVMNNMDQTNFVEDTP